MTKITQINLGFLCQRLYNKENNVFKDGIVVKVLRFKLHGNNNHVQHHDNLYGNYHDNHDGNYGLWTLVDLNFK